MVTPQAAEQPRRPRRRHLLQTLALGSAWLLARRGSSAFAAPTDPADPLAVAARAARDGSLDEALERLRALFAAGYERPADVLQDARFAALRADADARTAWRVMLEQANRQSRIRMVDPAEPGRPMRVDGRVVAARDGSPIAGAPVYLYHTDQTGHYAPNTAIGLGSNPRLFGFVRSDASGRFTVHSIVPQPYPGQSTRAAHVHYHVRADGYRRSGDAFRPYTHPDDPADRRTGRGRRGPITNARDEGSQLVCDVTLQI